MTSPELARKLFANPECRKHIMKLAEIRNNPDTFAMLPDTVQRMAAWSAEIVKLAGGSKI